MPNHVELIAKRLEKLAWKAKRQEHHAHKYEVRLRSSGRRQAYGKAAKLVRGILTGAKL